MSETPPNINLPIVPAVSKEIPVHMQKGAFFRSIHADSAWFNASPQGNIHIIFYSERTTIPKKIVVKFDENGKVVGSDDSQEQSLQGFHRELEADVIMALDSAEAFAKTLLNVVDIMRKGGRVI